MRPTTLHASVMYQKWPAYINMCQILHLQHILRAPLSLRSTT